MDSGCLWSVRGFFGFGFCVERGACLSGVCLFMGWVVLFLVVGVCLGGHLVCLD